MSKRKAFDVSDLFQGDEENGSPSQLIDANTSRRQGPSGHKIFKQNENVSKQQSTTAAKKVTINETQASTSVPRGLTSPEKRKRITSTFGELSQMIDLQATQRLVKDEEDMSLSQQVKRSKFQSGPRAGIIERLYMRDFKCHSLLEFNLHSYINFILGRNGSGKSAVMDAVILCLGGKAASTGRQASAKTFIKTGADRAELSLTLKNQGLEAYRPDLYGDKITIERKISKDGASTYRILNAQGKTVSNKKQELDNIVDQFSIQVENPVCFLTQEVSKHFLNSSNDKQKYTLFMKASQLEAMKQLREKIEEERLASEKMIAEKETFLPKLEDEVFRWEEKYKRCQSIESLRSKQASLRVEYQWAIVIECEKDLETVQRDKTKIAKQREKLQEKIDETTETSKQNGKELEKVKQQIGTLAGVGTELESRRNRIDPEYKEATSKYKNTLFEVKRLQGQIDKKAKGRDELRSKLNEEKKNTQIDFEEEKRNKENKVEEIKGKLKEVGDTERFKSQEAFRFKEAAETCLKNVNELTMEIRRYEENINRSKNEISRLVNSKNDRLLRFGDYMPKLVGEIIQMYNSRKFREQPKGPLGMFLNPKDKRWSLAIEQCLGGHLTAFVCGNYEDERTLQGLLAKYVPQVGQRPRIIVSKYDTPLYDTSRNRPEETRHPTVYEMLKIDDPVIANVLIDLRRIESILLLPDREVGRQVIEFNSTEKGHEAFLVTGDRLIGMPTFRSYSSSYDRSKYFFENPEESIQNLKREIAQCEKTITEKRETLKRASDELEQNKQLRSSMQNEVDRLKRSKIQLEHKLREAESIAIPEPVDLKVFEDEIESFDKEIEEGQAKIAQIEEESRELKDKFDKARLAMAQFEEEAKRHAEEYDKVKQLYNSLKENAQSHDNAVKHYKTMLTQLINEKEAPIDAKIKEMEENLNKLTSLAEESGARVETKTASKKIDQEITQIEKQIKDTEKTHGNEQEISRKYSEVKTKFKRIQEDIKRQKKFLIKLKQALDLRETSSQLFLQSKALRCSMSFTNYLNSRKFSGQLKFDHENASLNITVHPGKSKEAKECTDLKSLSGGERSYSTVAFLLSLWSIVESPILFLDEFDVFMDQINRNFAMELILTAAKENLNGQYVFLTPQEMGSIKPDQYVKMFKMPDPARNIDRALNNNNHRDDQDED